MRLGLLHRCVSVSVSMSALVVLLLASPVLSFVPLSPKPLPLPHQQHQHQHQLRHVPLAPRTHTHIVCAGGMGLSGLELPSSLLSPPASLSDPKAIAVIAVLLAAGVAVAAASGGGGMSAAESARAAAEAEAEREARERIGALEAKIDVVRAEAQEQIRAIKEEAALRIAKVEAETDARIQQMEGEQAVSSLRTLQHILKKEGKLEAFDELINKAEAEITDVLLKKPGGKASEGLKPALAVAAVDSAPAPRPMPTIPGLPTINTNTNANKEAVGGKDKDDKVDKAKGDAKGSTKA